MRKSDWSLFLVPLLLLVGCSVSKSQDPTTPDLHGPSAFVTSQSDTPNVSKRILWGLYTFRIAEDHQSIEIVPNRNGLMHLNVVNLMEYSPCTDCVVIENFQFYPDDLLRVDVRLVHPFADLKQTTAFDVRGIFISGAGYNFPMAGQDIAWGNDISRLLNSDGYTRLFNPTDFPYGFPPALGYITGHWATGGDLSATLNPYVGYCLDRPRCMFEAGREWKRTVEVYIPPGVIEFGYAIDANWQLVEDVVYPLDDFPPDANCLEAYKMVVQVGDGLLPSEAGMADVRVEIYDHQGFDTIQTVTAQAPDFFDGEVTLNFESQTGDESWMYTGSISNDHDVTGGVHPVLVSVTDIEQDQNLGPISAWQVHSVDLDPKDGWARTWGGDEFDGGAGVAVSTDGYSYVTGVYEGTIDFDPGTGTVWRTTHGHKDAYLVKYDTEGNLVWVRFWGANRNDSGNAIDLDGSGNIYVVGTFRNTVDFDTEQTQDLRTSNGASDAYVVKFDPDGYFQWVQTWGGPVDDIPWGVAADNAGNVSVTGMFSDTVDFDPGPGVDEHTADWLPERDDIFLSSFDASGNYNWVRVWGGILDDYSAGIDVDSSSMIYVLGYFEDTVDFDPDEIGEDLHSSSGGLDGFISKFDTSGALVWCQTWGSDNLDWPIGFDIDTFDNIHVCGSFKGTVDLDPGSGEDLHSSNGFFDSHAFLSSFDTDGNYLWGRSWGGTDSDVAQQVSHDPSGNVLITGTFNNEVDFDPGAGEEFHTAINMDDIFLVKYAFDGNHVWTRTWGGEVTDNSLDVASDGSENVYVTGRFAGSYDFNPGIGVDIHNSNGEDDAFLSKFNPEGNW